MNDELYGSAVRVSIDGYTMSDFVMPYLQFTRPGSCITANDQAGVGHGVGQAIGAAIGEGYTAAQANFAISRNPGASGDIFKSMLVGQAIAESASIFALVIAMILLFSNYQNESSITISIVLSAGVCMGLGAIGSGIGSGFPAGRGVAEADLQRCRGRCRGNGSGGSGRGSGSE